VAPATGVKGVAADCRHQRLCRHRAARNIQVPDTTPHHVPCHTHREVARNAAAPLLHADGCIRHGYRARRPPVKSMKGGGDMAPAVATPVGRGAGRHLPLRAPPPYVASPPSVAASALAEQQSHQRRRCKPASGARGALLPATVYHMHIVRNLGPPNEPPTRPLFRRQSFLGRSAIR